MLLSELKKGDVATVKNVDKSNPLSDRLQKMGLTEGVTVELIRFAPLGDPMEIRLRGFLLAIRYSDAKNVTVEKV